MQYNPVTQANFYKERPWQVWKRGTVVILELISFGQQIAWDRLTNSIIKNQKKRAIWLREKLTELGPTFVKLGQILSCRPDLIPAIYLEEFTKFQDQIPPFPSQQAYQVIAEDIGCKCEDIFAFLTPEPIAAASLGQVYKGQLKTGETVAIKVQRPGIVDNISLDVYLLRQLAAALQTYVPFVHSDLVAVLDELATRIFEEMDYIKEGRHAERFAELYSNMEKICAPQIYWDYTSHRVLTMEWIEGTKLTEIAAIRRQGLDPVEFISVGFQCSLQQLLEGGFFHADPHPGNILVTPEGRLAYLDFGMMSEVTPARRNLLIASILHIVVGDFERLARDYVSIGFLPPETDINPLVPQLEKAFGNIRQAKVSEFGFKQSFEQLSQLIYEYPWQAPTDYLLILRCFATLEGVAIKINPELQAFELGYAYVVQRLLTDNSPELRAYLEDFLLRDGTIQWKQLLDFLRQLRQNDSYELNQLLVQAVEFLYSPQGELLRQVLVDELVLGLEDMTQNVLNDVTEWMGMKGDRPSSGNKNSDTLKNLQQIWEIIAQKPEFNLEAFNLLTKPEIQHLAQQVTFRWGWGFVTQILSGF